MHGNGRFVTELRERVAQQPPMIALIEELIARKQTQFGHDLRLVGEYAIVERAGEWRLRVDAHAPSGAEEPGEAARERVTADTPPQRPA